MTKKAYELVARTMADEIETARAMGETFGTLALTECAKSLARDLSNENPRFDGLRFLRACSLTDEEIGAQR